MDPYLEDPALWPDVHLELISAIRESLVRQLRPRYSVRVEERVYVSDETDPGRRVLVPDVRVRESGGRGPRRAKVAVGGGIDLAEAVEVTELVNQEIREARLAVIDVADRSLVTMIEVISPSNKVKGSAGRRAYLKKRREVVASSVHLVEIDLLRRGAPVFAGMRLPEYDYSVFVSRSSGAEGGRRAWVWPRKLAQALPVVPVPLRGADEYASLDLRGALDAAYDRAGYDLEIDYGKPPIPKLSQADAKWARRILRAWSGGGGGGGARK
jgi:hypothetical protein